MVDQLGGQLVLQLHETHGILLRRHQVERIGALGTQRLVALCDGGEVSRAVAVVVGLDEALDQAVLALEVAVEALRRGNPREGYEAHPIGQLAPTMGGGRAR